GGGAGGGQRRAEGRGGRARPVPAAGGRRGDQRDPGDLRALAAHRVRPALPAGAARRPGAGGGRPSPGCGTEVPVSADVDVVVAGGGPAGPLLARWLRLGGARPGGSGR